MTKVSPVARLNRATGTQLGHPSVVGYSTTTAMRSLGPVVYAFRLQDGVIKIGYTADLARRRSDYGRDVEVLAILIGGTRQDEQTIHARLDGHQARGVEYYHPTLAVIAVVNEMRQALGLAPIPA